MELPGRILFRSPRHNDRVVVSWCSFPEIARKLMTRLAAGW